MPCYTTPVTCRLTFLRMFIASHILTPLILIILGSKSSGTATQVLSPSQGARPKVRSAAAPPPADIGFPTQAVQGDNATGGTPPTLVGTSRDGDVISPARRTELISPTAKRPSIGHDRDQSVNEIIRKTLRESRAEGSTVGDEPVRQVSAPRSVRTERAPGSSYTYLKDYFSPVSPPYVTDVHATDITDIRTGVSKRHSAFDVYPASAPQGDSGGNRRLSASDGFRSQAQWNRVGSGFALEVDQIDSDDAFERLSRGFESDTELRSVRQQQLPAGFYRRATAEVSPSPPPQAPRTPGQRPLESPPLGALDPGADAGAAGRHDSLEHLRDESPQFRTLQDDLSDSDLYQSGLEPMTFTDESVNDPDLTSVKNNTQRVTPDGAIENRYRRPGGSGQQPRPLNIDRNDCDVSAAVAPGSAGLDNTSANVNLNYVSTVKVPAGTAQYQVRPRVVSFQRI